MMRSSKDDGGDRDVEIVHIKRSLRTLPPLYAPSLVFAHGKKFREQTFCTLSDGHYHIRSIPEMRQMRCVASCYGWLIMQNYTDSSQCYLFNPISLTKIDLPPLRYSNIVVGVLSSSPIDTNCVVLLASAERNSFVHCRIGDLQWIKKDLGHQRKSRKRKKFTRLLSCRENIYLFSEEGIFVIDVHKLTAKFHKRDWLDDVSSSRPHGFTFKHFFVESCGEIFHIMVIYFFLSDRIVKALDVFRLEVSTMAWVQVESLGDRIFLLGATSSTSFSSTELDMKGNCIYFCTAKYTTLNRFDMEDGTLTTTRPCPKQFSHWGGPFWVVPNSKMQVNKETEKLEEVKYDGNDGKGLPIELLEMIVSGSFLGDCIRFRLICKGWKHITTPLRPYTSLTQTKSGSQQLPWLLSLPKNKKGIYNLYHPIYSDVYTINIPNELAGAVVHCAKYGWLLMSRGKNPYFFFNPFSKETIQLNPDWESDCVNISFSSPPTSPDCVVFGHIDTSIIEVYHKCEEDGWTSNCYWLNTSWIFAPAYCNPVFCNGLFYSLGTEGNLGILNLNETNEQAMWKVIPNTLAREVRSSSSSSIEGSFRSFLMEYDGEILAVIVGHSAGKPVWVYKLDQSKMKLVKLESLGDKAIFLSHADSIVVPAGLKGIENRIYLPRFQGRDIVYYSLSTGKYHWFGRKSSAEDWINTCEHLNCSWIQVKDQGDANPSVVSKFIEENHHKVHN